MPPAFYPLHLSVTQKNQRQLSHTKVAIWSMSSSMKFLVSQTIILYRQRIVVRISVSMNCAIVPWVVAAFWRSSHSNFGKISALSSVGLNRTIMSLASSEAGERTIRVFWGRKILTSFPPGVAARRKSYNLLTRHKTCNLRHIVVRKNATEAQLASILYYLMQEKLNLCPEAKCKFMNWKIIRKARGKLTGRAELVEWNKPLFQFFGYT